MTCPQIHHLSVIVTYLIVLDMPATSWFFFQSFHIYAVIEDVGARGWYTTMVVTEMMSDHNVVYIRFNLAFFQFLHVFFNMFNLNDHTFANLF
jgi:hypothetical protein